jgi:hypothetical protein
MNRTTPISIRSIISSQPRITIDSDEIDILQLKEHLKESFEPEQSPYTTNMFTFSDNLKDDEKTRYHTFLKICDGALKDFQGKKVGDDGYNCCSYYVENSPQKSLTTFIEIAAKYKSKYVDSNLRYKRLLIKNRKTIGARSQGHYYEKMSKEQILKLLCERHKQLGRAKDDVNKSPELHRYYEQEYARESTLFPAHVSQTRNEPILNCESLPSTLKLHEMADFIQFFEASFFAFKDTPGQREIEAERVINFLLSGDEDEKKNKVTRLLTFLPLELFNIDITVSPKNITIDRTRLKAFLIEKGPQHLNIQQYELGLRTTLVKDFSYGWPHLFMNMTSNFDEKNPYSLCDWSLWFNLFMMFIFSYSKERVFPLMFTLPFNEESVYNEQQDSYSFVTSSQYSVSELFNLNRQFIGVHFIRYLKITNGISMSAILPIFTFNNHEADSPTSTYSIYSIYDSKEEAVFNTDFFIARVEKDEIFSRMSITHQELYHSLKYFGLRTYIVGDDRTKLYLTRRDESSPALQKLISLLDMKRVIVKFSNESNELFRSFTVIDFKDARSLDIYPLKGPPLDFTEIENTSTATNQRPPDNSSGIISDDQLISMGKKKLYIPPQFRSRYYALMSRINSEAVSQELRESLLVEPNPSGGGKKTKKILKLTTKRMSRKSSKKMSTQKQKKNKTKIKKHYKTQKTKK